MSMASGSLVECELEGKEERGKPCPYESDDVSLLFMEVDSFVHPSFQSNRDFLHGVDHGGDLDV